MPDDAGAALALEAGAARAPPKRFVPPITKPAAALVGAAAADDAAGVAPNRALPPNETDDDAPGPRALDVDRPAKDGADAAADDGAAAAGWKPNDAGADVAG